MALSDHPVPILATPGATWTAGFRAVVDRGGIAAPLSAAYPPAELARFADELGADTVVVSPDLAEHAGPMLAGRRAVLIDSLAAAGRDVDPYVGPRGDPTLVLFTSGTTGRPKAAVITRGNLAYQTATLASAWGIGPHDRMVHALPLHHLHGLVVALLTAERAGASIDLLPRFEPAAVIRALRERDATLWMAVPTMYHRLREHAARDRDAAAALATAAARLRLATSGSAALPVGLAHWWRELHGAIPLERFGMTEIGIALSNPLDRAAREAGTVGQPLPGVEIRIRADDGLHGDGPGELEVRGEGVFAGYRGLPEATAAAFREGWFQTGDVATRGDNGFIRLLGRTSVDILKSGGYKLSALEIEEVLREHPDVADAAVVGLPDEGLGDRVVAAVTAAPGASPSPEGLRAFCRERLAAYKVPRAVEVLVELPRTPLGKVNKPALIRSLRGLDSGPHVTAAPGPSER